MATLEYDVIKEIPGYKVIMKSVLKTLIQQLVEQLASHTEEESVILTANVSDGTLSHLGSDSGKSFLDDHEDIKSQFLGFCLKRHHRRKQEKEREEREEAMREEAMRAAAAANQYTMRPQMAPRFMQRAPHMQHRGIHPVGLPRTAGPRGPRHEPYPVNRPRKSMEIQSPPSAQTGAMQLPVVGSPVIKTEPTDESDNNKNGDAAASQNLSQTKDQDDDTRSNSSANPNSETQDIKLGDLLPGDLGLDPDLADNSGQGDASDTNIKLEAISESEMDLEITGVEPGRPMVPQDSWGPSTSTGFDQSGATGSPGDMQGYIWSLNDLEEESNDGKGCGKKRKVYKCDECQKVFSTWYRYAYHKRIKHSDRPSNETECPYCKKRYSTKSNLRTHISAVHMVEKKHQCDECERRFTAKKDLDGHMRQHHGKDKFACEICNQLFGYRSSLTRHKESCGKSDKSHKCMECDKTYVSRDALYMHKKSKHSDELHVCAICGKGFERKFSLERHVRDVHKDV